MSLRAAITHAERAYAEPVRGMTLVEVLVSVFVLSVGLLGLISLQATSLRANQGAYLKTQASILAEDMAERIRLNEAQAVAGAYDAFSTAKYSTAVSQTCFSTTAGCTPAQLAVADLAEWTQQVRGTGGAVLLPGAVGAIARSGNRFTITVDWVENEWDDTATGRSRVTKRHTMSFNL